MRYPTLIILDWDDTLFPTTHLFTKYKNFDVDDCDPYELSELDTLVGQLLVKLARCGQVIIVTNAQLSWIRTSGKLMPTTSRIIDIMNISLISARDKYERIAPIDNWKKRIFATIVNGASPLNILSIGDSTYEYEALVNLHTLNQNHYLKNIKMISKPNLSKLIEQLKIILVNVVSVCNQNKHDDLKFIEK